MGWRAVLGVGGVLPGLPLLFKRGRPWFEARRELLLGATWIYTLGFMSGVVCNYISILDRGAFRNPLYLQSFGWLSVVGLAFQVRERVACSAGGTGRQQAVQLAAVAGPPAAAAARPGRPALHCRRASPPLPQLRFRWQSVAVTLAYCINTQLLPAICTRHFEEVPPARCVALGLLRVALHGVLLPLACCYAFELHSRRLFWQAQRRRARDA